MNFEAMILDLKSKYYELRKFKLKKKLKSYIKMDKKIDGTEMEKYKSHQ